MFVQSNTPIKEYATWTIAIEWPENKDKPKYFVEVSYGTTVGDLKKTIYQKAAINPLKYRLEGSGRGLDFLDARDDQSILNFPESLSSGIIKIYPLFKKTVQINVRGEIFSLEDSPLDILQNKIYIITTIPKESQILIKGCELTNNLTDSKKKAEQIFVFQKSSHFNFSSDNFGNLSSLSEKSSSENKNYNPLSIYNPNNRPYHYPSKKNTPPSNNIDVPKSRIGLNSRAHKDKA